jgi:SNF2 family DNA or RNA helicase
LLQQPSCKIDALLEIANDIGKPLVVFAMSKKLVKLANVALVKAGFKTRMITGDQSMLDRQIAVDDFQRGDVDVILLTTGAGGEGITLTRADTVVFLQRSWSNVQNLQAEDRIHRLGGEAHDSISVIDIVTTGTVDWNVRERLSEKQESLDEITQDPERLRSLVA